MRHILRTTALTVAFALSVGGTAWSQQTATEIKKELFVKYKKARTEGKDVGEAGKEYEEGDKALKDGMPEEALEHLKKAKELWPKE
jgi:hypothetical protein